MPGISPGYKPLVYQHGKSCPSCGRQLHVCSKFYECFHCGNIVYKVRKSARSSVTNGEPGYLK